jgi:hypothetical protein
MKKYLTAGLLAACLTVPAFAAASKPAPRSPDQPLPRSAIVLCIALLVGARAYKHRQTREQQTIVAYLL